MKRIALIVSALTLSATVIAGERGSSHHNSNPTAVAVPITVVKPNMTAQSRAAAKANAQAAALGVGKVDTQTTVNNNEGDYGDMVPSVSVGAPAPTISCYKTAGLSLNFSGFGGGFGGGAVDEKCEMREVIRLGQADSDPAVRSAASNLLLQQLNGYMPKAEAAMVQPVVENESFSNFERLSSLD